MSNVASTPAYPDADDIRYAFWLNNLTIRLPEYASRYQLAPLKVLQMHCLALDYIELLVGRMHQATAHICRGSKKLSAKEQAKNEHAAFIQKAVSELVIYITRHSSYEVADAHELRLPPPGSSKGFPS